MKYILPLLLSLFLFACSNTDEKGVKYEYAIVNNSNNHLLTVNGTNETLGPGETSDRKTSVTDKISFDYKWKDVQGIGPEQDWINFESSLKGDRENELLIGFEGDEPTYVLLQDFLFGYAKNDTLYYNESNKLFVYPENEITEDVIKKVEFFLDDNIIGSSSVYPFSIDYTPSELFDTSLLPCEAIIRIAPSFNSEFFMWEAMDHKVKVVIREE